MKTCSLSSSLLSFARSHHTRHHVCILDEGNEALLARIHLIRTAQKEILIQTFIWQNDETGRYVAYELLQAARRGIKIKILVDSWPITSSLMFSIATFHPNIEVRFYNPPSEYLPPSYVGVALEAFRDFEKMNHRMHSKSFIVDDLLAMVGGRNYQNAYYDRGKELNFKDRDVMVGGPVVEEICRSFTGYWNSDFTLRADIFPDFDKVKKSLSLTGESSRDDFECGDLFLDIDEKASQDKSLATLTSCMRAVEKIQLIADPPGWYAGNANTPIPSRRAQISLMHTAQEQLILQTPYFVLDSEMRTALTHLLQQRPHLDILASSNSLASTDNVVAYAISNRERVRDLTEFNLQFFEFKPHPKDMAEMLGYHHNYFQIQPASGQPFDRPYQQCHFCLHAKTYVMDTHTTVVSSANLDPRSAYWNSETGVAIFDKRFAKEMLARIQRDVHPRNSWTVAFTPPAKDALSTDSQNIECFELRSGGTIVPRQDPRFYENYQPVGRFPQAEASLRVMQEKLIETFGGPIKSLV